MKWNIIILFILFVTYICRLSHHGTILSRLQQCFDWNQSNTPFCELASVNKFLGLDKEKNPLMLIILLDSGYDSRTLIGLNKEDGHCIHSRHCIHSL